MMGAKKWLESNMPAWALDCYRANKFRYSFKRGQRTWSQEGEDMILRRILSKRVGFYVDIGAHHPYRYSNTYYLHQRGWSGINVDALPEAIRLFNRARPHDINVNVGISARGGLMQYFQFNDPAFNTFDEELAHHVHESVVHARLLRSVKLETLPLVKLLDSKLPNGASIDLMNVDVEGMDMEVLESNDWDRYRPGVLLVEVQWKTLDEILDTSLYRYVSSQDYSLYAKCVNTVIFKDKRVAG